MENNVIEFHENKRLKILINILQFVIIILVFHFVLKYVFNYSDHKLNYGIMIGWIVITLVNRKTKSLKFDDESQTLQISEQPILGKINNVQIKYNDAEFEFYNYNKFLSLIFGKKRVRILKNGKEVLEWCNITDQKNIQKIENIAEKRFKTFV